MLSLHLLLAAAVLHRATRCNPTTGTDMTTHVAATVAKMLVLTPSSAARGQT